MNYILWIICLPRLVMNYVGYAILWVIHCPSVLTGWPKGTYYR